MTTQLKVLTDEQVGDCVLEPCAKTADCEFEPWGQCDKCEEAGHKKVVQAQCSADQVELDKAVAEARTEALREVGKWLTELNMIVEEGQDELYKGCMNLKSGRMPEEAK